MQKHLFWLKWEQPYKHLATLLFISLITLITASIVLISIGSDGLIGWHTFSQKVAVNIISQSVDIGPFKFPFNEQLFVIKEFVAGGEMPNTEFVKHLALFIVFGLFALIITLFTYFNRWGFMGFSILVFFFIIFMHPEMLQIMEIGDSWVLGGIFFLFIGPAYYFHAYKKDASFGLRIFVMLVMVSIFLSIVVWQSNIIAPLNALFSYGILAPYFIVLLFIVLVGHEIVNAFAIAIAGGKDDSDNKRIYHFLVITFIYLLNVLLAYLQITHVIDWNFITINPIILLSIAALIGVWGISKRFVLYKPVSSFQQVWVLFYLALAVLAFTTITYLLYSLEDPMLKIIGDFIIYTQLSFGFAFLIYIVYNFSSIIEKGYSIQDILYKPPNLPHMRYRLFGVIILTALVLMRDIKYPIWYSLGGFYNSIAGYFEDQHDQELSQFFYEKGAALSNRNHKSNYKLGTILIDTDREKAIELFEVAASRMPTPQAFINQANLESDEGKYFDALFTLQKGIVKVPGSTQIQNNLGLQFQKANVLDSAWYYFSQSKNSIISKNNALTFVLQNNFLISESDSAFLFSNLNAVGDVNAAALGIKPKELANMSGDNMISASLLNNLLINELLPYSESTYKSILSVIDSTSNPAFAEELNYALAIYEFRNERITDALLRLQKIANYGSDKQSLYFETLGLINLYYGSYNEAERFFLSATESIQVFGKSYLPQLALAQSEAGYFDDAVSTWEQIKEISNEEDSIKAIVMIQVLNSIINDNDSIVVADVSLYLKARYQRLWVDEFSVKSTIDRIVDKSIKNKLVLELAIYYFDAGNESATKLFYDLIDDELENDVIIRPLLYFNIRMAYAGFIPDLDKHLKNYYSQGFEFNKNERLQKAFYETNRAEISIELAEQLASQNSYFAEGVVWAAQYFMNDTDEYRSYNILQEALDKNPDSRIIMEAYMIEAIDVGLEEYAINTLQRYRELFPGDQFYSFERELQERRAKFYEWEDDEE